MRIMGIAAGAIQQQSVRLEQSAQRVAKAGTAPIEKDGEPVDLAREAVERIDAGAMTEANLAVIKSEDERLGHLLDILV